MDRGIPTEAILAEMRDQVQMFYLVGTPKGRVNKYEKHWLDLPWHKVRDSVQVKLFSQDGELYVLAKSEGRQQKEIAIRRKKLVRLLRKLRAMRRSCPKRDPWLMRVGASFSFRVASKADSRAIPGGLPQRTALPNGPHSYRSARRCPAVLIHTAAPRPARCAWPRWPGRWWRRS
jgi:hypothetical protein